MIILYYPVCVPLGRGDFLCVLPLFGLSNVGQGYNDIISL